MEFRVFFTCVLGGSCLWSSGSSLPVVLGGSCLWSSGSSLPVVFGGSCLWSSGSSLPVFWEVVVCEVQGLLYLFRGVGR